MFYDHGLQTNKLQGQGKTSVQNTLPWLLSVRHNTFPLRLIQRKRFLKRHGTKWMQLRIHFEKTNALWMLKGVVYIMDRLWKHVANVAMGQLSETLEGDSFCSFLCFIQTLLTDGTVLLLFIFKAHVSPPPSAPAFRAFFSCLRRLFPWICLR